MKRLGLAEKTGTERLGTLSWSRRDAFFILVTAGLSAASFYQPLRRAGGGMIIVFLSLFSMLNPFSAVLYLGASQTLANAPGLAFTPAQLSAVGFALAILLRKRWTAFPEVVMACLKWMAPFLLFFGAKRIIVWNSGPFNQTQMLALAACLMTALYYREGMENRWLWFFCLCIGAMIGVSAFLLHMTGLEAAVQAGISAGRERLYVGRAANATSIGLVAGLGGMLSLWLAVRLRTLRIKPQRWEGRLSFFMLVMSWLALLTVFATASRAGAIGALIVIAMALLAVFALPVAQGARRRLLPALLVLMGVSAVMVALPQTGFVASTQEMLTFSQEQAEELGVNPLISGRYETWYPAFLDFLASPVFGIMPEQTPHTTYGAHNVFLSTAKGFGLVGLVAYVIYFAGPTIRLGRIVGFRSILPFVMFLLGIFLIFNSLNFGNYKTFHVYNGIVIGLILGLESKSRGTMSWIHRSIG